MTIEDKLGMLGDTLCWSITKPNAGEFHVNVWIPPKYNNGIPCSIRATNKNLHKAIDEAIELYKAHVSDCSIC